MFLLNVILQIQGNSKIEKLKNSSIFFNFFFFSSVAVKAKNFSIDYVSSVQRKEILSSPVLCRYMKITIIPTFNPIEDIQFLSVFPIGWIISELTATQVKQIQTQIQIQKTNNLTNIIFFFKKKRKQ